MKEFSVCISLLFLILFSVSCEKMELRNVAYMKAAWASSACDSDHTAQLVTDGIIEDSLPDYMSIVLNGAPMPLPDREWMLDLADWSEVRIDSPDISYLLNLGDATLDADKIKLKAAIHWADENGTSPYSISVDISEDGKSWKRVLLREGTHGPDLDPDWSDFVFYADIPENFSIKAVRLEMHAPDVKTWFIKTLGFFREGEQQYFLDRGKFHSCWISGTAADEWIYVDLGQKTEIEALELDWLNAPSGGEVLVSDDAQVWKTVGKLVSDRIRMHSKARYVKLKLDATVDGKPFALTEMKVLSRQKGGQEADNVDWKVARLPQADNPEAWLPANVPGTVLAAYLDAGALPDMMYSDWNHQISQSYFREDFVYRGRMKAPDNYSASDRVWLDFDGINWKADVSMNGVALGRIEGAFTSARFDVTEIVRDGDNEVEVIIRHPEHAGIGRFNTMRRSAYNGGVLGYDNPTFHASIGWDWMPSVAGRNMGIWNDVSFSTSGELTLGHPFVRSRLLEDGSAELTIGALLKNVSESAKDAVLVGSIADRNFHIRESLPPLEEKEVSTTMVLENPELWWPNGYGEAHLYQVDMELLCDGKPSDSTSFNAGIREMKYDVSDGRLTMYVNGRRFVGRGGNWGFSEANLRFRRKEYDTAVKYHREENFNMIRNWVGQTGDEEFYDACDRYGIMVWQDFWLANPGDGPNPKDESMFMANAVDYVSRIRKHPCLALFCGRNEGLPPESLDRELRALTAELTPELFYISHSSRGLVSGEGGYGRKTAEDFFADKGQDRFHSERGMPNMMNYESLVKMLPEDKLWPQNQLWAEHDWTMETAQRVGTFNAAVESRFGEVHDAQAFCELAQWVNYDGYRAMFEARSRERRGLLLWMSHSAWPSLVWSTYDYWFDPTASFYGAKKACEPLHIQWNPLTSMVEVVNVSAGEHRNLSALCHVRDMGGKVVSTAECRIDSAEDSTVECFRVEKPDMDVFYLDLELCEGSTRLSCNFYVEGRETDNFRGLHALPRVNLNLSRRGSAVEISNESDAPAMMLHLTARNPRNGERILPALFSDNYFHLMPGQSRTVELDSFGVEDCSVRVEGFNVSLSEI